MQSLLARSRVHAGVLQPQARPTAVRFVARASGQGVSQPILQPSFNIHGRHVDVTEELEAYVRNKLNPMLTKLQGAEFVEGEGGVDGVDVRLMNTSAEVTLIPQHQHKEMHDTFLRHGKLTASATGDSAYDSFDKALCVLEHKLKRWSKAKPIKTNYRSLAHRR